jgi:hypothetical protein
MVTGVPPNAKRLASMVCSSVSLIEDLLAVHASKNDLPPSEKNQISDALKDAPNDRTDNVLKFRQN